MKSLIKSVYDPVVVGLVLISALFAFAGSASAATAPTLGLAGDYAVFANTGIHTDPNASIITGNIGGGPGITSTAITGFALNLPLASAFSTSAQVSGNVYAFDYADPTPANVNTASLNMGAAYTAAAGETSTSACPGSGTFTDLTLVAGVYTCAVNTNIPTDLTLSGSATDIWIFQITGTLDMAAAKTVHLTGGALPQNIFWQVSEAVTIGANTHFEGIILGQTAINMGNLASINGRLLAQTAVNLDGNTIVAPSAPPVPGPVFIDLNINGTLDSGEQSFTTIQAAITAASTADTIVLATDITSASQIDINKSITINGAGHTLSTTAVGGSVINITANNVTLKNLVEDGGGVVANNRGINVYTVTGVTLDTVTVSNNKKHGIVVNGSTVVVNNITTSNNGWGGIDVDLGVGVLSPASLTINGISSHSENPAVLIDDITKAVSIVDTNLQYSYVDTGNTRVFSLLVLDSIAITTPATKLSYNVGDALDITGLVVTGTYSNASTQIETITTGNVTGFDSSSAVNGQVLTITFEGKTTTYTVDIAAPAGNPGGHRRNSNAATPAVRAVPGVSPAIPAVPAGRVLGASAFNFSRDLNLGTQGDDVTELQNRLTSEGVYKGPITGYFGPLTLAGVKAYQSKFGVSNTGYVGPLTLAKLNDRQALGVLISSMDSPAATAVKAQIVDLMKQLVDLLRTQLAAAIAAGQH